ncbi:NAD(P)-binding protein [Aspergillus karnatakaensis]|uniref:NAD(P)-binding protein n=1 Tax=Aspergillus karnatakaensis TaxID=1810916 RepID=UPI003CCCDC7F
MSSYAITGVSRGIGWEFLRQLSANPANTVIGIVRDKAGTDKHVAEELSDRKNIHIVQGDLTDYASLQSAAAETARITGGSLDYLIANAALLTTFDAFDPINELATNQKEAFDKFLLDSYKINTIGNIHLFSLFTPLILKGTVKKVIHISSGHADPEWINDLPISTSAGYAIVKAATNIATAKFAAQYGKHTDGVLFMSICPGATATDTFGSLTEEQQKAMQPMFEAFAKYAPPTFKGPRQPEDSVRDVLRVIEQSTVEKDGATFVSHRGDNMWLS